MQNPTIRSLAETRFYRNRYEVLASECEGLAPQLLLKIFYGRAREGEHLQRTFVFRMAPAVDIANAILKFDAEQKAINAAAEVVS